MSSFDPAEHAAAVEARRLAAADNQPEPSFAIRVTSQGLRTLDADALARLAGAAQHAGVLARTEEATGDYVMIGLGAIPDYLTDALPAGATIDRYT